MAVNPTTGIDPEVDRFLYVEAYDAATFDPDDPSTYRVLNYNESWRADGEPRNGANPRFMRFKKLPDEVIETDMRYYVQSTPEMLVTGSLPVTDSSLPVGTYQIRKEAIRYSKEVLKDQVEGEFQTQLAKQFPKTKNPDLLLGSGAAAIRELSGTVLTERQSSMVTDLVATDDAAEPLRARRDEMFAAIDADEDYDPKLWPTVEQ